MAGLSDLIALWILRYYYCWGCVGGIHWEWSGAIAVAIFLVYDYDRSQAAALILFSSQ